MCTIVFNYNAVPGYRLVAMANRDEFYDRPTKSSHWWDDAPNLLGGRDLREGGTWFGITREGRFATLTNYREPGRYLKNALSRGKLVTDFLQGTMPPDAFEAQLEQEGSEYNGFNLLFGDTSGLYYYSNRLGDHTSESGPQKVHPGIVNGPVSSGLHALSNHLLDSPWPKANSGKTAFASMINGEGPNAKTALELLYNTTIYPDDKLPPTGLPLERERQLSALFIRTSGYGTRTSWYLTISDSGAVELTEKSYVPEAGSQSFRFSIEH